MKCDYLIVGAGFYGSVLAERIANVLKSHVIVLDKREHIGGNCYSTTDEETGIEYHKYGTHIFHTSSEKVWNYITQFTEFNSYHHQVLTVHKNKVYQMPINLETINSYYNKNFSPAEAAAFIQQEIKKENIRVPKNFEEQAVISIGRPLYEAFIKNYTRKQWGVNPKELPVSIIKRLPVRYNYTEDYFRDARWQGIPLQGFTRIFENMLNHKNIEVHLNTDYFSQRSEFQVKHKTIYTGPIDQYFNYECGKLKWRGIELKRKVENMEDFQGTSVMNYADYETPYTRIHEFRHLHPEKSYSKEKTLTYYEYPQDGNDAPYYPVNTDSDRETFKKYRLLAEKEKNVIIGGRLGDYAYYDMDKTILAALKCFQRIESEAG